MTLVYTLNLFLQRFIAIVKSDILENVQIKLVTVF